MSDVPRATKGCVGHRSDLPLRPATIHLIADEFGPPLDTSNPYYDGLSWCSGECLAHWLKRNDRPGGNVAAVNFLRDTEEGRRAEN